MLFLLIMVAGTVPAVQGQQMAEIRQLIDDSRASDAWWSVAVRDSSGATMEALNAEKLIRPASNLKLFSTAAILDHLGPEFRYATPMYGYGHQEGDTWYGDIIIRGSGDPAISGIFYDEHRFHVFEKYYNALDSLGIRQIQGNLIGDDSYFDRQVYPKGWSWEDLTFYYGVEISALSFNNNAVDLEVFADGGVGDTPRIQWFPYDTDYVRFINEQVITPPNSEYDEYYRRLLGSNTIELRSKVPRNYYEEESLSVMNAPLFFMDSFREYLDDGGIAVTGRIIIDHESDDYSGSGYSLLAEHRSPPLRDLLRQANKESDNFYVEMLMKTMAAERYGIQGTTEGGIELVREFAHQAGIDTTRIEMTDGAGMSPATLLTSDAITRMLVRMKDHPDYPDYRNSLAVAGVDGTIAHRFRGTPLAGRVEAKTGYVSGVRALSGYMTASSGREIIFSVITNHYTEKTSYIDYLHEQILTRLYLNN